MLVQKVNLSKYSIQSSGLVCIIQNVLTLPNKQHNNVLACAVMIYRVSQKKCPIILKLSCLKHEHPITGLMTRLGRVILPAYPGTPFIWIFACMTEQQTTPRRLQNLTCAKFLFFGISEHCGAQFFCWDTKHWGNGGETLAKLLLHSEFLHTRDGDQ